MGGEYWWSGGNTDGVGEHCYMQREHWWDGGALDVQWGSLRSGGNTGHAVEGVPDGMGEHLMEWEVHWPSGCVLR